MATTLPNVPQRGRLADTLGQLLLDAIDDARSLDPRVFKLDMGTWLASFGDVKHPHCEVCLGGATMVCRLNGLKLVAVDSCTELVPEDFRDRQTINRILAINRLRGGEITGAYMCLTSDVPPATIYDRELGERADVANHVSSCPWSDDWAAHLKLAHRLIELGL